MSLSSCHGYFRTRFYQWYIQLCRASSRYICWVLIPPHFPFDAWAILAINMNFLIHGGVVQCVYHLPLPHFPVPTPARATKKKKTTSFNLLTPSLHHPTPCNMPMKIEFWPLPWHVISSYEQLKLIHFVQKSRCIIIRQKCNLYPWTRTIPLNSLKRQLSEFLDTVNHHDSNRFNDAIEDGIWSNMFMLVAGILEGKWFQQSYTLSHQSL